MLTALTVSQAQSSSPTGPDNALFSARPMEDARDVRNQTLKSNAPDGKTEPLFAEARRLCVATGDYAIIAFPLPPRGFWDALTAAERSIVYRALQGLSNAEIARSRRRSTRTIANQLASAFRKLNVQSRRELQAAFLGRNAGHDLGLTP